MNNWWIYSSAAMEMVFSMQPLEPHIEAAVFIKPTEEKLLFTHRIHALYMNSWSE